MTLFQPAVKEQLKARVAIDGPTGSGKTYTALQWARIIAGPDGPIGLVDTENRSAAYYAPTPGEDVARLNYWEDPYEFGHLPVSPPYSPVTLRGIIQAAGEELGPDGVLVIDSLTHFWNGEGGTLDVVDNASQRSGNSFTGWKEGTPAQRGMLDAIIHAKCHVIVTMRSKMEYVLEETTNRKGHKVSIPKKIGMQPEQRSGVEYEFTVVADMDLEHRLIISKSRCKPIADEVVTIGRTHEPAEKFAAWLGSGVARVDSSESATIVAMINETIVDQEARSQFKALMVAEFGRPTEWTTDRQAEIEEWVTQRLAPFGESEASTVVEETSNEQGVDVGASGEAATNVDPSPEPQVDPDAEGEGDGPLADDVPMPEEPADLFAGTE